MPKIWSKAIILVDMNAFFASIEQMDYPELNGQPVVVTNGEKGTCIITCSYEARAYGINTGMRIYDAKKLCPNLIQCPSRPKRYAAVSTSIMEALHDITPDVEVFSVDEAFLDVTYCQRLYGSPILIGKMVKKKIMETANILCSIGISGDKTTAKYAAKLHKPNGFTIIHPWEAKQYLHNVPVTELCGIADGIGKFLAQRGVHTCGDMAKLPIGVLAKRFGNIGRRIWYMCQGQDPEPVKTIVASPKSIGHGKILPPKTKDRNVILAYLRYMSEKVAARLRRHHLEAQVFFVGILIANKGWITSKLKTPIPTNDGQDIYKICHDFFISYWTNDIIKQVQVTALEPKSMHKQADLFTSRSKRRDLLNQVIDSINFKYGKLTLVPASLQYCSMTPNVIAPSWQPAGHRQTI